MGDRLTPAVDRCAGSAYSSPVRCGALGRLGGVVAIMLALHGAATARAATVDVSFATDKLVYQPDDEIHLLVTAHNPSASPVTLNFANTRVAQYQINGGPWYPQAFSPAETSVTILPGASTTWDLPYLWRDQGRLPIGEHTASGRVTAHISGGTVFGPLSAGPVSFVIVPDPMGATFLLASCMAAITRRRYR